MPFAIPSGSFRTSSLPDIHAPAMQEARKAKSYAALGFIVLVGGCVAALAIPSMRVPLVAAGFAGYVACGRRAMILWNVDERVFEHRSRAPERKAARTKLVAAAVLLSATAGTLMAQQTIFNVPSADVLDPGKVYGE